ncbi:MAG: hypothetical protein K5683_00975 [Prevotella sp.]|nr:hypothetical protein [Prevotella sp.]
MRFTLLFTLLLVCGLCPSHAAETKIEAEKASYSNCKVITDNQYSGGKALELTDSRARITFSFSATASGKYSVFVCSDGLYGNKVVNLSVNGNTSTFQTGNRVYGEIESGPYMMNAGKNTIIITPNWDWFRIDYIRIADATGSIAFDIPTTTTDANATESAREMYAFLFDNFGKKTISGIMTGDMTTANGNVTQHEDVKAVLRASGKYPALVGFDFMNATGRSADYNSWYKDYTTACIQLAKDLYKRGGLPAFTWHWRDPSRSTDEFYCSNKAASYCAVKISSALNADGSWNTSSRLYQNMIKDIHTIADYFLKLQDEGVACIFRPLHEASGAWFWWGNDGADSFTKLYRLIRDEMVSVKGVHNVIWVWNPATADDSDWNPGEDYYDVVGIDIYNDAFDYSSNYIAFERLKRITNGKKIITLSENGPIPDIDKEFEEDAVWSWWMPWYQSWSGAFVDKTSKEEWTKCMGDERVITLEDLAAGWGKETNIKSILHTDSQRETIYNLYGQKVNKAHKGLYIINGKKVVK